jgi:predicted outer membrane protein
MTLLRAFASVALALVLRAPYALADPPQTPQDRAEVGNPNDVNNRDRKTDGTAAAITNAQSDKAAVGNPHSTLNKDQKTKAVAGRADLDADEMDDPDSVMSNDRDPRSATPSGALERLHAANLNEIAIGKLAQQNGTARAREYGKTLERDHGDADQKVKALAGKRNLKLADQPVDMMATHEVKKGQRMQGKLAALHGAEFDKALARMMTDDHRKEIVMVKAWRTSSKDAELSSLLDDILPALEQHERTAEQLKTPAAQGRRP